MYGLKRYALVIGNFNYEILNLLKTPENDCADVGEKLKNLLGFQVSSAVNTTLRELYSLVDTFTEKINDDISDIVFYYSGHGCSIQGKNYLIPIDGLDSSTRRASRTYVSLDDIINSLVEFRRSDTVPIIVILDCCRSESIVQNKEHQSSGLIKDDGKHINTFIMYATGSNQVASDGNGRNGTFTEYLLTHMSTDEDIEMISKNILTNLRGRSSYRNGQISWTSSSLFKPYNFRTASKEHKTHNLHPTSPQEKIFWPKHPENFGFVDRPEVFKELDRVIKMNKDNNQFRPIVLCGLGGMGKSQIALKFCYRNKDNYQYIFWMDADTEAALQSSFLDAAKMLDLPGFVYTKPENIVPQMILWFHNSDGWLLIFDNCDEYSLGSASESHRLQNKYFPKKGNGVVLMTTRNSFTEEDINLNEMKMDDNTALELLMKKKIDVTNIDPSALEIVKQLGHLPLAIDLAGALMKMEKLTPADFLKGYNEDPIGYLDLADIQEQTGSSYGKTVLTVWKVSFDRIKIKNPLAADLLKYIAFLYPDNIPLTLFSNHSTTIFKDKAPSARTLSATANLLQSFSLVQRRIRESSIGNSYTKDTLTIHRLVQKVILFEMRSEEKLQYCEQLISILNHEAPSESQLGNQDSHETMEAYVPHIRHVTTQFSQLDNEQCNIPDKLISLLSSTIVYLTHQCLFEGVENLAKLCISTSEKNNGELHPDTAAALSKLSYLYISQNDFKLAEPHCLRCLRIRRKIFGPIHKDTVSSLHDLAFIYRSLGMERHATQLYWEAAITGDQDAQGTLATRYYKGIGAPVHEKLASYWRRASFENLSSESLHLNAYRIDLTPLHHLTQQGDIDKIQSQIIRYKQYAMVGDRDGKTSLHIAAENGNVEIMKLLLNEYEIDKNIQDNQGQTPLHLAAKNGDLTIVKLLITEFGSDVNIMDINKKTPVQLAVEKGHFGIINFILDETSILDIDLEAKSIGDIGAKIVANFLKQITFRINLDLSYNKIGAEGFHVLAEALKKNTALTNLNLKMNKIGAEGGYALAEALKQNTTLTSLNLCGNEIDVEGTHALAEALKQNTVLTNLNLGCNSIGAEGAHALAEALKQNITLTTLNLENNNIDPEAAHALAEALKQNTALINLNLENNRIGNEGAHALAEAMKQNTTLSNLNLYLNYIGAEGAHALAKALKKNTALTNLSLFYNNIGAEGAHALAESLEQNTALSSLNLNNNNIGAEGTHALAKALKKNIALTSLNLNNNKIGAEGAHALAEALKQNTVLANLNLEKNEINPEGVHALAEALKQNTALTSLNLFYNTTGPESAHTLAEALKQNTALSILNLNSNRIGPEGAHVLAEALKQNTTLTNISLGGNEIDTKSAHTLAEALKQNTALTNLDLSYNKIGPESAHTLAEALKQNTTLTDLNLFWNKIGAEGTYTLAEALKENTTLTSLDLEKNEINAEGFNDLVEALKQITALTRLNLKNNRTSAEDIADILKWSILEMNQEKNLELNTTHDHDENPKRYHDVSIEFEFKDSIPIMKLDLELYGTDNERTVILNQEKIVIELDISEQGIGIFGAKILVNFLKYNTTLTELYLRHNDIGDDGTHALAEVLTQNTTLSSLDLSGNGIGIKGANYLAECLKQNAVFTNLNISNNNVGAEGAHALADALVQNTTLTNLNLSNNNIGAEGVHVLAEALKQNTTLINFDLTYNGIGAKGSYALAEGLKQNTAIADLYLRSNSIFAEGASALAECLKQNRTLTNLDMSNNEIGSEGAGALAESLIQNTTLTSLNLKQNGIGSKGVCFLAECLKQNIALTNLNLEENKICAIGANALAQSLKHNATLTILDLKKNEMGDKGARFLVKGLKQNTALIYLNFEDNCVGIECTHTLTETLKQTLRNLKLKDKSEISL